MQIKSREDLQYDGEWRNLPGIFERRAKSRYTLKKGNRHIDGGIVVAYWHSEPDDRLFYYTGETSTTVEGLTCMDDGDTDPRDVYHGVDKWGSTFSCEQGPSLTPNVQNQLGKQHVAPPTIFMNRLDDQKVFLIVEESSSYPSFMYSVWSASTNDSNSTELQHEFHIAATMRLAEAVVTGIVHGETTGGGCFGLLRQYSYRFSSYDKEAVRAFPFGESPGGDSNANIQDMETLEYGLQMDTKALMCFVSLVLLTSIGVAWSFCLRSSARMDVYDRDQIIRAVCFHGVASERTLPPDIRIFVRKEDTGNVRVVISDTEKAHTACAQFFRGRGKVVERVESYPVEAAVDQYNHDFGGAHVPVGSRKVWLEGVRAGLSRACRGPNVEFNPTSVALSESPAPSIARSLVSTPILSPSRRALVPRDVAGTEAGAGVSAMLDRETSTGDSPEEAPNDTRTAVYGSATASAAASRPQNAAVGGDRPEFSVSQATPASDIEMPESSGRIARNVEPNIPPMIPDREPPERRGLTYGRCQREPLAQDSEEGTEESMPSFEKLNMETE